MLPVADPARLTPALVHALGSDKALWLVVHANHAREFTPAARDAVRLIQAEAIPVLGQSVLLRGVNDTVQALEDLFRAMLRARVKPYYLHQLDPAPGTARRGSRSTSSARSPAGSSPSRSPRSVRGGGSTSPRP